MHLYIWLLGQTDHAVSDYCIQMAENKQKHSSCYPYPVRAVLVINITLFSPSEDESWPGDQARRPYLAPEETKPPPLSPPKVAAQKPQYQPVTNNYSTGVGMVSRRAIISRSRDDLQHHLGVNNKNFTGEDQWFSKEKLYKVC